MSVKPKVYQGVQVKNTVKELLQRHRAREANSKNVKMINQACLVGQDLCTTTFASRYEDPPPAIPTVEVSSCGAAPFLFSDSPCNIQMQGGSTFDGTQQHQQQHGDAMLPSYNNNNNNNIGDGSGCGGCGGGCGGGYSAPLPPPPTLPLPRWHGLSSDADYYGHGVAPCPSPESLKFCNPVDHNGYSPQDSFSSSSSSCYDSPTRMESSYTGFSSKHFHYQHCSLQDSYCLPHWPGQQESFSAPEYAPYYNPTDYPYACSLEENYLQMSSEMCYNIL